jgi:NADH/F420H2 dehydrogenase subunit C
MKNSIVNISKELKQLIPIYLVYKYLNEISIVVSQSYIIFSLKILKLHINFQYKMLSCISGVDLFGKNYRFSIVYELLSIKFNNRIRVKSLINNSMLSNSIISIFNSANWWEREIWDMFGVFFLGHSDLRRILTDYGFEGHPLKKDFPLIGFIEVRYSENKKKLIIELVNLSQDFRIFGFKSPW